jgi:S-DNA-T family DNA segregation ATPase FtsK/SpoIIIE
VTIPLPGPLPPIAAPRAPEPARPYSFPAVASVAPVAGALLIWLLTKSSFALIFALLGPIVAIGSLVDARLHARRRRRQELARFAREIAATRTAVDGLHAQERARLTRASPGAVDLRSLSAADPERWRGDVTRGVPVRLGLGVASSTVRIEGLPSSRPATVDPVTDELERLREYCVAISDVPIVVDARLGVGICGSPALAGAVARGLVLQLAQSLSPADSTITASSGGGFDWVRELPHGAGEPVSLGRGGVRWRSGAETAVVVVADRAEHLPADCRVVMSVGVGRAATIVRRPEGPVPVPVTAEFVSAEQAAELAGRLAAAARARGISRPPSALGWAGGFQSLPHPEPGEGAAGGLACVFARSDTGPIVIDLVADGPHAVIGGTTGSGKSELLVSWVLAMACSHPPSAVTFLLVDFKGGSSFDPLRPLPHVVGIVTDLDELAAQRAMLSLRAELRFRERALAAAGARTIDDPAVRLPRLVIVVDEFAAMATGFPELHELFADLAARGRSLGLHLMLCTQRPAGAIRDAVLANAALRVSLRVNNRADSIAVIGTADAVTLPADAPGRAWLSAGGDPPRLVQAAKVTGQDIGRVAGLQSTAVPVRRPWCDDLPSVVRLADLAAGPASVRQSESGHDSEAGIPFGLVDLPEQQCQQIARYDPSRDGNLLVIGAQRSGKSEFLRTLGAAVNVERCATAVDAAWDGVTASVERLRSGRSGPRLLLVDDLDALIGRLAEDYQSVFVDRLVELAREGSSIGLQLVITVRRVPPTLQTLASLCDCRLVLRLATRQDHLLAGGTATGYSAEAGPGAGEWKGSRVQVALHPPVPPAVDTSGSADSAAGTPAPKGTSTRNPDVARFDRGAGRMLAVVSTRPGEFARRLRALEPPVGQVVELGTGRSLSAEPGGIEVGAAGARTIVVGDPDSWQANWAILGSARSRGPVVFDRCSVAEFRALGARRTLPPPIRPGVDQCWVLEVDGTVRRMMAPAR